MARQRKKHATTSFDAITIEGALITPAMIQKIATRDAGNQTEADYRVPKGLTIRDEIARYFRIGQALFVGIPQASTGATIRFTEELLREVFGFTDIAKLGTRTLDDHHYAVTLEALGGRLPVVVVPPTDDLDRASDHLPSDGRRRSASSAIQDWLNANDDALWGFCCNGLRLRLVRDNASLTRPAYIEADLRQMFEAGGFADFAALWLLIQATRFGIAGSPVADCSLERWREAGTKAGLAARERLREGVEQALLALGSGFLSENPNLRDRVNKGELPLTDYFGQLLRLIYRLIFLAVAEDRNLLHDPSATVSARMLYAEGYSFSSLKERSTRRSSRDQHHDRWEGLLILFTALHGGEKLLGLPALGGLFQPELMPDLLNAKLPNRALMEAIYRLAWLKNDNILMAVNWRDMETEELGSVYESLLELTPRLTDDGRGFMFAEGAETKGNARKTSGSYYTPDSLVQTLLDSALDPVLDQKEAQADDVAAALLTTTVIDPACGSGHFLLAAARRIASRLARARAGGVASAEDYRHALRDVARNCIHGVDRNPMAVELTKVALWIETVEPGKPLGFLDANIRCGDSLLGVFDLGVLAQGIPDEAYKPLTGDDKETAKYFSARNKAEKKGQGSFDFAGGGGKLPAPPPLAPDAKAIRALPEDSAEQIAEKKKRFASGERNPARWAWRTACDLYVAAFLLPKKGGAPANANTVTVPTSAHVWQAISGPSLHGLLVAVGQGAAMEASAFHWPLEFPDVMASGGFDCVLGNPPWERIKLQEQEFFASREPEIANAPNAAARGKLIAKLKSV
jgi:N-6 DNA Methylase